MEAQIGYAPAPADVFPPRPQSYLEQNYAMHVFRDAGGAPGNDILAAAHPNGIAFLALAPSHAALRQAGLGDGVDPPNGADATAEWPARLAFELPEPAERGGGGGRRGGGQRKGKKGRAADVILAPGQAIARLTCGEGGAGEAEGGASGQRGCVLRSPFKGRLVEANVALEGLEGLELLCALRDGYLAVVELKGGELARAAAGDAAGEAAAVAADGP